MLDSFKAALARIQSDYEFYIGCQTDPAATLTAPQTEHTARTRSVDQLRNRALIATNTPPEPMPNSASPMTRYV